MTNSDRQRQLYSAAIAAEGWAARAAAVRDAVNARDTSIESFDEGEVDLLDHLLADDRALLDALNTNSHLDEEDRGDFGSILANDLVENARHKEIAHWRTAWEHSEPTPDAEPELAYEDRDPKHPGFLDRVLN